APEVRFASVTGRAGMQLGMLFYSEPTLFSEPDEQRLAAVAAGEGFWAVSLDAAEDISPMDLAIWERHHLPLAHENAYPVAALLSKDEVRRPDARLLAYFEGLLDAIAATTEDEMDSGRWEKKVVTADGPVRYVLSLPGVLNPPPPSEIPVVNDFLMEQIKAEITRLVQATGNATQEQVGAIIRKAHEQGALTPPRNDRERAQQLIAHALPARGRRQVALARQALKLWPDCVDAHLILAHREQEPERAIPVYEKALAAGERALGAEALRDPQHPVWTQAEAQPYLRGLIEIAQAHAENGGFESAAGHLREALRLDPDDTLDARYPLAGALSHLRRYEELAALLDRFREDDSAEWTYTRTLLIFRREGDSLGARSWLTQALRRNAHVPKYLLQEAPIPFLPPFLQPGSEAEAMSYAASAGEIWNATPGALAWLFERASKRPKKKTKGRRDRKRKR
ncbi:MAG TPA: hypothetical protein VE078_17915, partial [Thermoanaerobaculia bacterium]|nr:hypothetical protein [Thermoanaerobaculia bacterium]